MSTIQTNKDFMLVTHFNSDYLLRGLTMINSLKFTDFDAEIIVIAHDQETKRIVEDQNLKLVKVISLKELEREYPRLKFAKTNRSSLEFIYCLSPFVIKYAFDYFNAKRVIYLDADLYFFRSPLEIINQTTNMSIVIVGHHYPERFRKLEAFGKYNVGWVQFTSTENSLRALEWWSEACLNSTSSRPTKEVYGDQKYLDQFEIRFKGVEARENLGENLAPWNLVGKKVKKIDGVLRVDNQDLYYFHFSGLRLLRHSVIHGTSHYSYRNRSSWKKHIFKRYEKDIYRLSTRIFGVPPFDNRQTPFKLQLKAFLYRDLSINLFKKNR
jgi:hypothetical protein